jgi:hypothetical protein
MTRALMLLLLLVGAGAAAARDLGQWNDQPAAVREWYQNATLTAAARKRFNFIPCCSYAEVVQSQFRVDRVNGADHWFYRNAGAWAQIPDDIIHWDESAPDNKPTLFALDSDTLGAKKGDLTCFYPPGGGF